MHNATLVHGVLQMLITTKSVWKMGVPELCAVIGKTEILLNSKFTMHIKIAIYFLNAALKRYASDCLLSRDS